MSNVAQIFPFAVIQDVINTRNRVTISVEKTAGRY